MSSFSLKLIAMFCMLSDHLGDALLKQLSFMNLIGRIALPIFAFQISEGYFHTKNLKKYFFRLFIFAIISQIPYMCFLSTFTEDIFIFNTLFTLLAGLLCIYIYDTIINLKLFNKIVRFSFALLIVIFISTAAQFIKIDYGFFGVMMVFLFYMFRDNKLYMFMSYALECILYYSINIFIYGYAIEYIFLCLFTILPIVFILLYNKKQGKKIKYLFYFFYPVHLLLIFVTMYFLHR